MEDVKKVFEKYVSEEVLTEEVKAELSTIIEALVMEKAEEKFEIAREALIQEYDSKLNEAIEVATEEQKRNLNDYVNYSVEKFVEENKVKIQNSMVVEKATKLIDGIQKVFEENGINLATCEENIVESLNQKNDEVTLEYNQTAAQLIETRKDLVEAQKAIHFMNKTQNLTAVEQERLMNLMSGIVTESVDDFNTKLDYMIKNVRVNNNEAIKEDKNNVTDSVVEDRNSDTNGSASVNKYLDTIKRN